jgi:hypothetical protein
MAVRNFRGIRLLILACTAALLVGIAGAALADEPGYSIDWWTVDGGGGTLEGNTYTLSGTVGQPDARSLESDTYRLAGGFWNGLVEDLFRIFLPLIERVSE